MSHGTRMPPSMAEAQRTVPAVVVAHRFPKRGESPDDCQDAVSYNLGTGCFAIADGAAGSFFPAPWARLLAERFCAEPLDRALALATSSAGWDGWLQPLISNWEKEIQLAARAAAEHERVVLRNRLAAGDPAAATFAGVVVQPPRWHAVTIGDSCLFHIRGNHLERVVPVEHAAEFDSFPECLATSGASRFRSNAFTSGQLELDDLLILATDAFCKWLLTQHETDPATWNDALTWLRNPRGWGETYARLERFRSRTGTGALEDDDVALLVISMQPGLRRPDPPDDPPRGGDPRDDQRGAQRGHDVRSPDNEQDVRSEQGWWRWVRQPARAWAPLVAAAAIVALTLHSAARVRRLEREVQQLRVSVATISVRSQLPDFFAPAPWAPLFPPPPSNGAGPLAAQGDTVSLVAGTALYTASERSAKPVLTLRRQLQAVALPAGAKPSWHKVEVVVWIAERAGSRRIAQRNSGASVDVLIEGGTARSEPRVDTAAVVGRFAPASGLSMLQERADPAGGRWFQVRVPGFVEERSVRTAGPR